MRIAQSIVLLFLILVETSLGQDRLPPDNALVVVSGPQEVVLSWPGNAKSRFQVQVFSGQSLVLEREVSTRTVTVRLRIGRYRWRVLSGGKEILAPAWLQVTDEAQFVIAGDEGRSGEPGTGNGTPGEPGPNLLVTVSREGDYQRLVVGGPARRTYYLMPGTGFHIAAPGGRGGNGANGAPSYDSDESWFDGGPGGDAGDGGSGGTITVVSNGHDISNLTFDVGGGNPGRAGHGGGSALSGRPGVQGSPGKVLIR